MSHQRPLFLFLMISFCLTLDLSGQVQIPGDSNITSHHRKTTRFASQFWTYLLSNNYKHWSPSPGETSDYFASRFEDGKRSSTESPHGVWLKTYINRTSISNTKTFSNGSVIILENYRVDKSLQSISVMYRTPGFNPEANDWYWINYEPDGSVSESAAVIGNQPIATGANGVRRTFTSGQPMPSTRLMGRASSCIECHRKSSGNDFVFFNDLDDIASETE